MESDVTAQKLFDTKTEIFSIPFVLHPVTHKNNTHFNLIGSSRGCTVVFDKLLFKKKDQEVDSVVNRGTQSND